MEELAEGRAVTDSGFAGCAHARPRGKSQVLLVDRETLEAMELRPGILRENITTTRLNVNSLAIGQQLRIGETRLEVTEACTPCDQMAGTSQEALGRRGMLCRVIEGGIIRREDRIEKIT